MTPTSVKKYVIAFLFLIAVACLYLLVFQNYASTGLLPFTGILDADFRRLSDSDETSLLSQSETNSTGLSADSNASQDVTTTGRANATLLMLARNSDVNDAVFAIRSLEEQFNGRREYPYPWVFLNEVPFDDEFRTRVSAATRAEVQFGLIKPEEWYQPDWIDEGLVQEGKNRLGSLSIPVPYYDSSSYRNMCRYNSGFFFRHELLAQYKWYWRVEPSVEFLCPIDFDPFEYMIENDKRYSFVISLEEYEATISSLWSTVTDFFKGRPDLVAEDNALPFISNDGGDTYNLCHFWSNFEIADLDFFRSDAYMEYFNHLDATGGFYYERWGDAPVHSIAASLMLPRSQLHFFGEIGYYHLPFQHCPTWLEYPHLATKCMCRTAPNFDYQAFSCLNKFHDLFPPGMRG